MTMPRLSRWVSTSALCLSTAAATPAFAGTSAAPASTAPAASAKPAAATPAASGPSAVTSAGKLSPEQAVELLKKVDDARHSSEDLSEKVLIEETLGNQKVVREGQVYTRGDDEMVMLFTNPKTVAGSGYFRAESNLWSYDPSLGKWERKTDRERLSGTNVRQSDIANIKLATVYDPSDDGLEQLGDSKLRKLVLKAKPNASVSFPVIKIWVDDKALQRKSEEYSESNKLLRTTYITKVMKVKSKSQNRELSLPAEMQLVDEVQKDRRTVVVFKAASVDPIPQATFSKAWLESKSR